MKNYNSKFKNFKYFLLGNLFGLLINIIVPIILLTGGFRGVDGEPIKIMADLLSVMFGWSIVFIDILVEDLILDGLIAMIATIFFWGIIGIVIGVVYKKIKSKKYE